MQQKKTSKRATPAKRERAAILVAEDALTDAQIADEVGIDRSTLARWKHEPDFQKRVALHLESLFTRVSECGLGKRERRMVELQRLYDGLRDVQRGRAERYAKDEDVPAEAKTGLIEREETVSRSGSVTVTWSLDTGLLAEYRNLQKQAAAESDNWIKRREINVSNLPIEALVALLEADNRARTGAETDGEADADSEAGEIPD